MTRVSVLFFDLDNTLYPLSLGVVPRIDRRINDYLRERLYVPAAEVDGLRRRFWAEHGTTLRGLMLGHGVDADEYLAYVHEIELADLLRPDPVLRALLERLRGPKVVFSNASRAHAARVLRLLGLEQAFDAVFGLEDLSYLPKPDPRAFHAALDRVGARAEASLLIDDLRANLAAAKRLGMGTIWVDESGGADGRDASVDHVVSRVHEIEAILEPAAPARA